MGFYTIWVRSLRYRGQDALTYSHTGVLPLGAIVAVPLQKEIVLGFVVKSVSRPSFAIKPIAQVYNLPPLPAPTLQLATWLVDFYASNLGVVGSLLLPGKLSEKTISDLKSVVSSALNIPLTSLNPDQSSVVKKVTKPNTYLLHGRTGSGKTRVYTELALRAITSGKSVLVMTPEISLTSQLAQSFYEVFTDRVIIFHSHLTATQRQKLWLRILTSKNPLVIIGPRSVLFTPVKDLGLIVMDETHEPAYKQEQAPYYQARSVASQLALLHNAQLVLGSATPSVSDYYMAEQRQKPILTLNSLAQTAQVVGPTKFTVVDLKDRSLFTRSSYLSQPLLEAVRGALEKGKQSLIYLNRRGTARVVLCENCGWQALCPHCDLPLVYHGDSNIFRCHTCGFSQDIVTSCPVCGHPSVTFKSFGTKAITDEIRRLFSNAKVQRFDTDNTRSERFEQHYESVKAGDVDILVGTQLLAKGLDLPNLSTLGIVLADSSLYLPDFSSRERTYQLLAQALGRVGRGHVEGHAIIQTYQPESSVIQAAVGGNWQAFYESELAERQKFHFPPYYYLLKLTCRRASYKSAESAAQKLKEIIAATVTGVEIDGPTPSFHEKLQGKYQSQLVIRSTERHKLLHVIKLLPASGWTYDIDPINLL